MGGGVDKSHGVGITSGLSGGRSGYSKGGKAVEAIMNFINPMNITKGKKVTKEVLDEDAMDMRRLAGGSGDDIMKTITEIQNPTKRMMALRALSSV